MSYKNVFVINIISIIGVGLLFSFTTPESYGLALSALALLLFYIFAVTVIIMVLKLAYEQQMKPRKILAISLIIGTIVPMLLAISSLSSLRALDVVLIIMIPLVVVWYLQKRI